MKHLKVRIPMYFIGLFIMTIGIALSVKSNPGQLYSLYDNLCLGH